MPDTAPSRSVMKFKIELVIFCVLIIALAFISWLLLSEETKKRVLSIPVHTIYSITKLWDHEDTGQNPGFVPSPAASAQAAKKIAPLPVGKQSYTFSHGQDVQGPKPTTIVIDPLTPSRGDRQTVQLTASYSMPITRVEIEVITDSNTTRHPLKQVAGSQTDGTWEGSWEINGSYETSYGLRLMLTSTESYDSTMWLR